MADAEARDAALERFRRYRKSGDRSLRNALIEEHRWVAVHCARQFANRGEPLDDLIQVAQVGLLKAVERFDPDLGVSFTSFAMPTVLGELRRHFRDKTWAVRVPRRLKELHLELAAAREELANDHGRAPTADELAAHLGVSVEEVLEGLEASAGYRTAPLARPSDEDGDGDRESVALRVDDDALEGADDRIMVNNLLGTLPEREQRIVRLRFFSGLSQAEIADEIGVSQVHVSRLLRASLAAMQRAAEDRSSS